MRCWVEIDTLSILKNIEIIKKLNKKIIAVVKANAYGLGAIKISKILQNHGIDMFAVATLCEGIELRENGIIGEILVLAPLYSDDIEIAQKNNLIITVAEKSQFDYIFDKKSDIPFHIKIDTGMGRLGFEIDEGIEIIENSKNLNLQGIYTHLSRSDEKDEVARKYTISQLEKFKIFKKYENQVKYIHILNSGGILYYSDFWCGNAVRPGICMYGAIGGENIPNFYPTFKVLATILSIKTPKEIKSISYGGKGVIKPNETYAIISMGYADGLKKIFSGCNIEINGKSCEIVGEICMDMCMVKVPYGTKIGDTALIFDNKLLPLTNAPYKCACDTLTGLGNRVERIYKEKENI